MMKRYEVGTEGKSMTLYIHKGEHPEVGWLYLALDGYACIGAIDKYGKRFDNVNWLKMNKKYPGIIKRIKAAVADYRKQEAE